ncbi:uroporphyrinogen decarboxylase family protein [Chloroflexota bacterium]
MASRTGAMTDRQRVEALLNHQKPDRVPIWPFAYHGFAVIYSNLSIYDAYTNPEACYYALRQTCRDFGWVFFPRISYAAMGAWEFGGEVRLPSGEYDQAPMVTRYPVEKDEDVYNLKWPGPDSGFYPVARKYNELARQERLDNEPFNASINAGGGFGLACNIVGVERFLKWLIKKPELAHYLIRTLSDWMLEGLPKQREALGTDGVLGMSGGATTSNQLISPAQFAEFALPTLKEQREKLKALGYKTTFVHICGDHNDNLPFWSQIDFGDPAIISVGHEVKLATAAKYFPGDIILGNLEPAIVQTATPAEVYEATKEVVEEGKKIAGGYIFSTGCDLPPKSPVENVMMMNKAVDDFGWYD